MQSIYQFRFLILLSVLLLCGCSTSNEVVDKADERTFGELIANAHFVAKELHFNMQSGVEHQLNASVFDAFKEQIEGIAADAAASDLSEEKQAILNDACNSLKRNFEHVISGAEDYHDRFSRVDVELFREIEILESLKGG